MVFVYKKMSIYSEPILIHLMIKEPTYRYSGFAEVYHNERDKDAVNLTINN